MISSCVKTGELSLKDVMRCYELSSFLPALFEEKESFFKADKPQLAHAVAKFSSKKSDKTIMDSIPPTEHYVLDSGPLIHCLPWKRGGSYGAIAQSYTSFVICHKATVVFEGCEKGSSIKDNTRQRRGQNTQPVVSFNADTEFVGKKMTSCPHLATNRDLSIGLPGNCRQGDLQLSMHQEMQMWTLSRLRSKHHDIRPRRWSRRTQIYSFFFPIMSRKTITRTSFGQTSPLRQKCTTSMLWKRFWEMNCAHICCLSMPSQDVMRLHAFLVLAKGLHSINLWMVKPTSRHVRKGFCTRIKQKVSYRT